MSSTKITKSKGPATTVDDINGEVLPAPARNKSGRFIRQQPTEEVSVTVDDRQSGTAAPTIPSGSGAIDEGTPVNSVGPSIIVSNIANIEGSQ